MGSSVVLNFQNTKSKTDKSVSIKGLRLGFSALRLFEHSAETDIKNLLNKVALYCDKEHPKARITLSPELSEWSIVFNNSIVEIDASKLDKNEEIIYLYKNAVTGLPFIAEASQRGCNILSWETLSANLVNEIPDHCWVEVEKNIWDLIKSSDGFFLYKRK